MRIDGKTINKLNKMIMVYISVISLFWLIFIAVFLLSVFFVDDGNIVIFKIASVISLTFALWSMIFFFLGPLSEALAKKKFISSSLKTKNREIQGEVSSISGIKTIVRHVRAMELEISIDGKKSIYLLLEGCDPSLFSIGEYVYLDVADNLVVGARK